MRRSKEKMYSVAGIQSRSEAAGTVLVIGAARSSVASVEDVFEKPFQSLEKGHQELKGEQQQ